VGRGGEGGRRKRTEGRGKGQQGGGRGKIVIGSEGRFAKSARGEVSEKSQETFRRARRCPEEKKGGGGWPGDLF